MVNHTHIMGLSRIVVGEHTVEVGRVEHHTTAEVGIGLRLSLRWRQMVKIAP